MNKQTILIIWAVTALAFHVAAFSLAYLGLLK
jgi:predicted small secreted protein